MERFKYHRFFLKNNLLINCFPAEYFYQWLAWCVIFAILQYSSSPVFSVFVVGLQPYSVLISSLIWPSLLALSEYIRPKFYRMVTCFNARPRLLGSVVVVPGFLRQKARKQG